MRILKLTLKNINSLAGESKIDFTNPAFTNDGLFAITGKTGAGKSSILDAISLALYGKTPRVDISGSENAVMTKGEKDCFAEVEFEVGGNVFKASWKQELTKSGNLKPVSRQIADVKGKILADQVRSCDTEIVKIMGLTFDQFTKVIMLAQGSFTAFLQANKNEKGELLEQITGTEIYAQISRVVFENSVEEKKKLDRLAIELEGISVLNDEEILALNQEIESITQEKAKRDQELVKLEKAKNWLGELKLLEEAIEKAKEEIPILEEKRTILSIKLAEDKLQVDKSKKALADEKPILKKVNTLDTQIQEKNKSLLPFLTRINQLEIESKEIGDKIKNQQAALEKSTSNLKIKEKWALEHKKYEPLVAKYSAIERDSIILTNAHEELQSLENELNSIEKDCSAKKVALEDGTQRLIEKTKQLTAKETELVAKKDNLSATLQGKTLDALHAEKESNTILHTHVNRLIEIEKSIVAILAEVDNYKRIIESAEKERNVLSASLVKDKEALEAINAKMELLTENISLIRHVESLDEHRSLLKDSEPCPLCGSEEHPYAMGNIPKLDNRELQLKTEKENYNELNQKIQENEKKFSELGANHNNAAQNIVKEQVKLNEITAEKSVIIEKIKTFDVDFVLPKEEDGVIALTAKRQQIDKELNQINTIIQNANACIKDIETLRDLIIPDILKENQLAQAYKNEAETHLKLIQQQFNDKSETFRKTQQRFLNDKSSFSSVLEVYGVSKIEDLKRCLEEWEVNQDDLKKLKDSITVINSDIKVLQKASEENSKNLSGSILEKDSLEKELNQFIKDRKALFGEKSVEEVEKALELAIEIAENSLEKIKKESEDLIVKLESNNAILKEKQETLKSKLSEKLTDQNIEEIEKAQQELKEEADKLGEKIGENRQKLTSNEQNIIANEQKLKQKEKQYEIYRKWKNLDNLIGSSDGKKYRNFAQALTFEHLVSLANIQLQKMSDRYLLKRVGENNNPFDLAVIDKFQNNDERTAQNLSGGEKFIVSLSLALGLSSMASKNMRIDTMFIDEGFGTLDSDYLDVALNALSNLQNEGKIIGVISHIAELKERIATHIEIVPSGNGRSLVRVT